MRDIALKILLVDDDRPMVKSLSESLTFQGHVVRPAHCVDEAAHMIKEEHFDLILTDYKMENGTGLDLIKFLKRENFDVMVVVMTAYASYQNAVEVVKEGAFDYLTKPCHEEQLKHVLRKVQKVISLKKENEELKKMSQRADYFYGLTSHGMKHLEDFINKVAPTDATVLITGESGTGKSYLAKHIHDLSSNREGPFVEVHCTTLSDTLIESELFGHVKGSFTGAHKDKKGKIEIAEGGTLLLDEIGELSPPQQTKLLRFLQERVIEPVGSNETIEVSTRVIAATNKDLKEMVEQGKFREDLYYRLNMFECLVPSLRYHKEDTPVLAKRFLQMFKERNKLSQEVTISPQMMELFARYDWPGNVRELKNVIERLCFLSNGKELVEKDLPDSLQKSRNLGPATAATSAGNSAPQAVVEAPMPTNLEELERRAISQVLQEEKNLDKAAERLGITTVTLWRKRKQYGLP